jgi:hypothetical protein
MTFRSSDPFRERLDESGEYVFTLSPFGRAAMEFFRAEHGRGPETIVELRDWLNDVEPGERPEFRERLAELDAEQRAAGFGGGS